MLTLGVVSVLLVVVVVAALLLWIAVGNPGLWEGQPESPGCPQLHAAAAPVLHLRPHSHPVAAGTDCWWEEPWSLGLVLLLMWTAADGQQQHQLEVMAMVRMPCRMVKGISRDEPAQAQSCAVWCAETFQVA
jgi:hypothetical protein